jgi:AcrR family transcriptional regulator
LRVKSPPDSYEPSDGRVRRTLPRGPKALPREQVAADQLQRLQRAMIDSIGEKGYRATTIADLVGRAGVSRKTFYEHFANKQECLLATFDVIAADGRRRAIEAYQQARGEDRGTGDLVERGVEAALRALFEATIDNPGAARLNMVEIVAAGPAGIARRESAVQEYRNFVRSILQQGSGGGEGTVPATVVRAVVGGLNRILYSRVRHGQRAELRQLVPDLMRWVTCYRPTPPELAATIEAEQGTQPGAETGSGTGSAAKSGAETGSGTGTGSKSGAETETGTGTGSKSGAETETAAVAQPGAEQPYCGLVGGRAPGTLASVAGGDLGLVRSSMSNVLRSFILYSQRERILDAVANLTATGGYADLTVEKIAGEAAMSLQTFYDHFRSKEEAFLFTYEVGHARGLALVERAYEAQADWPTGVKAAVSALLHYLGSEPAFAQMALRYMLVASPRTAERANLGISEYLSVLEPGFEETSEHRRPPAIAIEAIGGGLGELMYGCVMRDRAQDLPSLTVAATYISLAPFVGPEQAARVAIAPLPAPVNQRS